MSKYIKAYNLGSWDNKTKEFKRLRIFTYDL